jgi:Tol biopolymer transport system component
LRAGELDPKALRARQSLVLVSPDGKEERRIVEDEAGLVARFSPDGSRLLLTTQSPDGSDLWVEPVEGGDRTRIAMTGIRHVDACWSPDGRHLAVSRYDLTRRPDGRIGLDLNRGPLDSRLEVVTPDGKDRRWPPLLDGVFSVCDWR